MQIQAVATLPVKPAAARHHVVVVGGGMAGTTVAKYLRLWSDGGVDVTPVDRLATYTSCIMSSLVLTGQRSLASLKFDHRTLRDEYGVRILTDPDAMPHAWKAGPQTRVLARQLDAMAPGGTVLLTIPQVPYRCPPGPYERACLLADWLKQRKPGSRLVVLDANPDIVVEKDNFSRAFFELHEGVIEYRPNSVVDHVDTAARTVLLTDGSAISGQVVNLIPRQRAGQIVIDAGLATATEGRFAPVDVLSYASSVPGAEKVHVIGDSSATTQPKAGHIASQPAVRPAGIGGAGCSRAIISTSSYTPSRNA